MVAPRETFFGRQLEEGGRLSAMSVFTITAFMSVYTFALLMGSLVFWRLCAGV